MTIQAGDRIITDREVHLNAVSRDSSRHSVPELWPDETSMSATCG